MLYSLLVELLVMLVLIVLPLQAAKWIVGLVTKESSNRARLSLGLLISVPALVWAGVGLYISGGFLNDYKNAWISADLATLVLAFANGGLLVYLVVYCLGLLDIIHTLFQKLKQSVEPTP